MAEPFEPRVVERDGLLSKVTSRVTRAGAIRELETLLAEAECVRDVTLDSVRTLGERHGVDLVLQLRTLRRNLYRRLLEHCLLDFSLSETEVEDLDHLRRILCLEDHDVAAIQDQVSRQVYGAAVEDVLADHHLDDEEVEFLRKLRSDLDLSAYHANRIVEEGRRRSQARLLAQRGGLRTSFLAPQETVIQLEGVSSRGLEGAVQAAVDQASEAFPKLAWGQVSDVVVQIESGRIVSWKVKVRAGLKPLDEAGPPA